MATKKPSGNPFARNASKAQTKATVQKNASRGAKKAATKKYRAQKK